MGRTAWIVVGLLLVLGVAVGLALLAMPGEGTPTTTVAPPPETPADEAPPPVDVGLPSTAARPAPRPPAPSLEPDPDLPSGLAPLHAGYARALALRLDLDDLPADAPPSEVDRVLAERLRALTAGTERAVQAHLLHAKTAPRAEAKLALSRAAELRDHAATALREGPIPQHLSADEQRVYRTTMERMAQQQAREAAQIRAGNPPEPKVLPAEGTGRIGPVDGR